MSSMSSMLPVPSTNSKTEPLSHMPSSPKSTKKVRAKPTPPREYPPVESCQGNPRSWLWRTQSSVYRRRVKKATELVQRYRMAEFGSAHMSRANKDAVHRLLDTLTFDANKPRRTPRGGSTDPVTDSAPRSVLIAPQDGGAPDPLAQMGV